MIWKILQILYIVHQNSVIGNEHFCALFQFNFLYSIVQIW